MTELLVSYGVLHVSGRKTTALPYIVFEWPEVRWSDLGGKSVVFWRSELLWSEGIASSVQFPTASAICHCTNIRGVTCSTEGVMKVKKRKVIVYTIILKKEPPQTAWHLRFTGRTAVFLHSVKAHVHWSINALSLSCMGPRTVIKIMANKKVP